MIDREKMVIFVLGGLKALGLKPEYESVLKIRNMRLIPDTMFRIVRNAIFETPELWETNVEKVFAEPKEHQPDEEKPKKRGRPKKEAK